MHLTENLSGVSLEATTTHELTQRYMIAVSLVQTAFQEQALRFLRPLVRGVSSLTSQGERLSQGVIEADIDTLQNEINPLVRKLSTLTTPTQHNQLQTAVAALEEFHRKLAQIQGVDAFRVFLDHEAAALLTKVVEQSKSPLSVVNLHPAIQEYLRKVSPLKRSQE